MRPATRARRPITLAGIALALLLAPRAVARAPADLDAPARRALVTYAYEALDHALGQGPEPSAPSAPRVTYARLFITLLAQGHIRACMSGRAPADASGRLVRDVRSAVERSVRDERFGGVLTPEEGPRTRIVFTFLYGRRRVPNRSLQGVARTVELGVHAIELRCAGRGAFFKESVPLTHGYTLQRTLQRLCRKAGLPADAAFDPATHLYRYETHTFVAGRGEAGTVLYRYNMLVDPDAVSPGTVRARLRAAHGWLGRSVDADTGLIAYWYDPIEDQYADDQNHVRALGTIWSVARLGAFLNDDALDPVVGRTLDQYLAHKGEVPEGAYLLMEDNTSKLAYNAFLVLVLLNAPDYPDAQRLRARFADGMLALQEPDGSYRTYYASSRNTGVEFYPGEAMLALMRLYQETEDPRLLDSVRRAFPYYRAHWRAAPTTAFVPWHIQADRLLWQATGDPEVRAFVCEMADWLLEYQVRHSPYPDEIGGFPPQEPRYSTAAYLEGLVDAHLVARKAGDADRAARYARAVRLGVRFLFQLQFTEANTFFLENPQRAVGGFHHSLTNLRLRNDYTQHAVMALMKAQEAGLLKELRPADESGEGP